MSKIKNEIYNPDYVKNLFNRMSNSYERMNYITSFGFSIRWRKQYLKQLKTKNEKVEVIDLLTGMGETWGAITKKYKSANITALDFSEGMLEYANNKNQKKFNSKIKVIQQDILNNQLPSDHYDFVTCAFGLKTFNPEQVEILASETKRILKQGGQCSFIEVSKPNNAILTFLYGLYLGKIVPILGKLLLGNPEEYKMLWTYTLKFKNSQQAVELFKKQGLSVTYQSYFGGCATGFIAEKL
ncbi:MAG: class I SAM-dependent methyltransferase [Bacteroidia bacterium]|nr:class I SAM-dependent methyltransferase [Bacteroidia bacterium]